MNYKVKINKFNAKVANADEKSGWFNEINISVYMELILIFLLKKNSY